jgi:hypothetical protein
MSEAVKLVEDKVVWARFSVKLTLNLVYTWSFKINTRSSSHGRACNCADCRREVSGEVNTTANVTMDVVSSSEEEAIAQALSSMGKGFGKPFWPESDEFEGLKPKLVRHELVDSSAERKEPFAGWAILQDVYDEQDEMRFFACPQEAIKWAGARALEACHSHDEAGVSHYHGQVRPDLEVMAEMGRFSTELLLHPGQLVGFGAGWDDIRDSIYEWSCWFKLIPVETGKTFGLFY